LRSGWKDMFFKSNFNSCNQYLEHFVQKSRKKADIWFYPFPLPAFMPSPSGLKPVSMGPYPVTSTRIITTHSCGACL
jgi:hypothetical protein